MFERRMLMFMRMPAFPREHLMIMRVMSIMMVMKMYVVLGVMLVRVPVLLPREEPDGPDQQHNRQTQLPRETLTQQDD